MRITATCLLAAMVALLLACVAWQPEFSWLAWPRAFSEAGAVGAIADWYAVVALFRHPLGLAIPHTAIIPRNQARIAESLGDFIEKHFLTPDLIVGRLSEHNAARALSAWLAHRENSAEIASGIVDSLPRLLERIDESDVASCFERFVLPQLARVDVSRMAGQAMQVMTEGGRHRPLLDRGLTVVERWLTANVDLIKAKFSEASRFTPAPLDAYIVNKFVEGIVALIREVAASPDHELRRQFDDAIATLSFKLQDDAGPRRFGRLLLRDCIRHFRDGAYYGVLLDRARARLVADAASETSVVHALIEDALVSLGKGVASEPSLQVKLNGWWLDIAEGLVLRYRHRLSGLIADVVKGWDAREVGAKIEAEIGRDLQFIRINGTFVGGIAGVLIHLCVLGVAR
ncbi:DUF445 domain-containing protein [Paraburkholderia sp. J67]|uniref:DUF445 domain-containing protein n=1 Tax=Paraburkholderia sp. J67 TaxID=2805435 RepID=UPI002ABDD772|nr:DUF445 domain-containing protein [Paraburkholderia sp. J67]